MGPMDLTFLFSLMSMIGKSKLFKKITSDVKDSADKLAVENYQRIKSKILSEQPNAKKEIEELEGKIEDIYEKLEGIVAASSDEVKNSVKSDIFELSGTINGKNISIIKSARDVNIRFGGGDE